MRRTLDALFRFCLGPERPAQFRKKISRLYCAARETRALGVFTSATSARLATWPRACPWNPIRARRPKLSPRRTRSVATSWAIAYGWPRRGHLRRISTIRRMEPRPRPGSSAPSTPRTKAVDPVFHLYCHPFRRDADSEIARGIDSADEDAAQGARTGAFTNGKTSHLWRTRRLQLLSGKNLVACRRSRPALSPTRRLRDGCTLPCCEHGAAVPLLPHRSGYTIDGGFKAAVLTS